MKKYKYSYSDLQHAKIIGGGSGAGQCDHCQTHLKHFVEVMIAGEKAYIGTACASQILNDGEKPEAYYKAVVRNSNASKRREQEKEKRANKEAAHKVFMAYLEANCDLVVDKNNYIFSKVNLALEYIEESDHEYYGKKMHIVKLDDRECFIIPPAHILSKLEKGVKFECMAEWKESESYYGGRIIFNSLTKIKFN